MFRVIWKRGPRGRTQKTARYQTREEADRIARHLARDGMTVIKIEEDSAQ